jgi:glycosyltransferase involved in cell wall biosynthesis
MRERPRKNLLIISQTFVPDPASVGQHITDVALEMARRGHRVRVLASARGYEDASLRYPLRENLHGVEIRRIPLGSFGKKSLPLRVFGTASFMLQVLFRALFMPDLDAVFFSTSPPLVGIIACILHWVRRVPIAYWAMDLNPDQLVALGKLEPESAVARLLEAANRIILRESSLVIALDRFMADRLAPRGRGLREKTIVLPPWPHEDHMEVAPPGQNPFRARHALDGKFVVMYSGNHSPSNPLTTLLRAAVGLKHDPDLRFLFVGGGSGKREVEEVIARENPGNIVSLPYQPLAELGNSLSAADVHVVSLGEAMVGIIHPCKIYGAMAVGRPILYLGPRPSHVSDLLDRHAIGWQVSHGDVRGAIETIRMIRASGAPSLRHMGANAQSVMRQTLGQRALCSRIGDALDELLERRASQVGKEPSP